MYFVDGRLLLLIVFWKKNWGFYNVFIINILLNEEKLLLLIFVYVKFEGGVFCELFVLVIIFGRMCGWLVFWVIILIWICEGFNGFKVRFWVVWLNFLWWWWYWIGKYGE